MICIRRDSKGESLEERSGERKILIKGDMLGKYPGIFEECFMSIKKVYKYPNDYPGVRNLGEAAGYLTFLIVYDQKKDETRVTLLINCLIGEHPDSEIRGVDKSKLLDDAKEIILDLMDEHYGIELLHDDNCQVAG